MNEFEEYIAHGWQLCRIQPGQKGPRTRGWNKRENAVAPDRAKFLQAAGLMHAYSGTCSIDIDNYDMAAEWLKERGVDLDALRLAPDAVQIISGQENRGKLIYALPDPLPSVKLAEGALELRCGTRNQTTTQDVLPPSPHPSSGQNYEWKGDWRQLPPLPESLMTIWLGVLGPTDYFDAPEPSAEMDELRELIAQKDPDCGYDEWLRTGMAIHHETEGTNDGLALWNEWSAKGDKYSGFQDLEQHWRSFGNAEHPVTAGSLRASQVATADDFPVFDQFPTQETPASDKLPDSTRFRFLPLDELFTRPEPDWLIPGVLPRAMLGAIWGQPGSGKTFVAIDLALSVALGSLWQDKPADPGSVLYIAAEDDAGVQSRFAAGLAARGVQNAPVRVLPAAPSLLSPEQSKALYASILATSAPSLIFVDTLAAVTPGTDENSAKDVTSLIYYCHILSRVSGGMVMWVHHPGKDSARGPRGSSAMIGAFDVEWAITDEDGEREMRIAKLKNARINDRYKFNLIEADNSCVVGWR